MARHRLGRIDQAQLRGELIRLARLATPPSRVIDQWVALTTTDSAGVTSLMDLRDRLPALARPRGGLFALEVQIAALSGEWEGAVQRSREWLTEDPFNPNAVTSATYMIGMGAGRLHEAIRLGEQSLRRFPANPMVSNNVAFAKALLGDIGGAERSLASGGDQVLKPATAGLIALARGDASGAGRLYQEALERVGRGDPGLAATIGLYRAVGEYWFADGESVSFSSVPVSVRTDLRVTTVRRAWDLWIRRRAPLD